MTKEQIIQMSQSYSKDRVQQRAYIAGFQATCNLIRKSRETNHQYEFLEEMEALSEIAYIDFDY